MNSNCFVTYIFPQANSSCRKSVSLNLRLKQHQPYGKPRRCQKSKEQDPETGLYYFGARYLDPHTSLWLSADPALGEYIPQAPINDEAKKHNENLPGMGGVFNYVNFHVYHYAGNNPVELVDPDGKKDKPKIIIKFTLFDLEFFIFNKPKEYSSSTLAGFLRFLDDQGVTRENDYDSFVFEKIADSWDDLPDDVKNFDPQTNWGKVVKDKGFHQGRQLRLPNGYHISEEYDPENPEVFLGVYVHRDRRNPLNGIAENIIHPIVEPMRPIKKPDLKNDNPDWEEVDYLYE